MYVKVECACDSELQTGTVKEESGVKKV